MDLKRELRRSQNSLTIAGAGVIAFGFWSVLRAVLSVFADRESINDIISEALSEVQTVDQETYKLILEIVYGAVILLMSAAILLVFLYIGRSCIAVGRRGKKRLLYLPMVLAIGLAFLYSAAQGIKDIQTATSSAFDSFSMAIVDFSTGITMLGILYSSIRIVFLKGRIKKEAAHEY